MKNVSFLPHAETALLERKIAREWILDCLRQPERMEPDPKFSNRIRAYRRISQFGDRWLRVVFEQTRDEVTVVTAFFDRDAREAA